MKRRKKTNKEYDPSTDKTIGDIKSANKSKEQMKKDWGSPRSTMNRKLRK